MASSAPASYDSVAHLYSTLSSYVELCRLHTARPCHPLVAKLTHRIANWRYNHNLSSLESAFVEHRLYTLYPVEYYTRELAMGFGLGLVAVEV